MLEKTRNLNDDMHSTKRKLKDIQKTMKEITTTMISIILAISIIPTAIGVLQDVKPEFVLPIVSTVILFGMTMILFVYLINQIKVDCKVIVIYIVMLIITVVFWHLPWHVKIEFVPKAIEIKEINFNEKMSLSE